MAVLSEPHVGDGGAAGAARAERAPRGADAGPRGKTTVHRRIELVEAVERCAGQCQRQSGEVVHGAAPSRRGGVTFNAASFGETRRGREEFDTGRILEGVSG